MKNSTNIMLYTFFIVGMSNYTYSVTFTDLLVMVGRWFGIMSNQELTQKQLNSIEKLKQTHKMRIIHFRNEEHASVSNEKQDIYAQLYASINNFEKFKHVFQTNLVQIEGYGLLPTLRNMTNGEELALDKVLIPAWNTITEKRKKSKFKYFPQMDRQRCAGGAALVGAALYCSWKGLQCSAYYCTTPQQFVVSNLAITSMLAPLYFYGGSHVYHGFDHQRVLNDNLENVKNCRLLIACNPEK